MSQARTDHDPFPAENVEKVENYTGGPDKGGARKEV